MPIRSYLPIAIAMLSAAGLSFGAARVAVDRVETGARVGILNALTDGGMNWTRVEVDGLQVRLSGTAPDEAARFAAISATNLRGLYLPEDPFARFREMQPEGVLGHSILVYRVQ